MKEIVCRVCGRRFYTAAPAWLSATAASCQACGAELPVDDAHDAPAAGARPADAGVARRFETPAQGRAASRAGQPRQ